MTRRRVLPVLAVPVLALSIAACGGDESGTATPAPVPTTSAAASSSEAPSSEPTSASAAPSSAASSAAPTSAAAGGSEADPGPAPAGTTISADTLDALPESIGGWTKLPGPAEPAALYEQGSLLVSVGYLPGSDYAGISTSVAEMQTPAGTGVCGTTTGGTSKVCYLAGASGVFTIAGDDDQPVPELVVFANQVTAALGTS